MREHIMLDLETLSSAYNSAIISIGAVKFNLVDDDFSDTFYTNITFDSVCDNQLFNISGSTLNWWFNPERNIAREQVICRPIPLINALRNFTDWYHIDDAKPYIWGNGATFDNVILRYAYQALNLGYPWTYKKDMCYRTIKNLNPTIEFENYGTYHNALDDAIAQAKHLQKIFKMKVHKNDTTTLEPKFFR